MRFWIPLVAAAIAVPASVLPASAVTYQATVGSVVDVATLVVTINGQNENVKLIGVQPAQFQAVNYWAQGRQAAINLLQGRSVQVETDVQARDAQGRLLAWIFVNGVLANEALIRQGAAVVSPDSFNVRYAGNLLQAQQEAARAGAGVWNPNNHLPSPSPYPTATPYPTPSWTPTPIPTWSATPKPLQSVKPGPGKKKGHAHGKGHQKGKGKGKGHDKHDHD